MQNKYPMRQYLQTRIENVLKQTEGICPTSFYIHSLFWNVLLDEAYANPGENLAPREDIYTVKINIPNETPRYISETKDIEKDFLHFQYSNYLKAKECKDEISG